MENKKVGGKGEFVAAECLKNKGYKIVKTNYTNKIGEIDIIAYHDDAIVFVEVKTRSTSNFGYGKEAVDFRKQQKIRNVATAYLKQNKLLDSSCRFDVIEINNDKIDHIENAF